MDNKTNTVGTINTDPVQLIHVGKFSNLLRHLLGRPLLNFVSCQLFFPVGTTDPEEDNRSSQLELDL